MRAAMHTKVGDKWVVVAVRARKDADPAEFDKQRSTLTETALSERRNQSFDDFLVEARRRLDEKGQIQTFPDASDNTRSFKSQEILVFRNNSHCNGNILEVES